MSDPQTTTTLTGTPFDVGAQVIKLKLSQEIEHIEANASLGVLDDFLQGAIAALMSHHTLAMGAAATREMLEKMQGAAADIERDMGKDIDRQRAKGMH